MKNSEVVERVQKGIILDKPKACFKEVYDVMKKCWSPLPENRPSFRSLKDTLVNVSQGILVDWLARLVCETVTRGTSPISGGEASCSWRQDGYEEAWLGICRTLCREVRRTKKKTTANYEVP